MKKRTDNEILEFFKANVRTYDFYDTEVKVKRETNRIVVEVSQEYQYVPVDFEMLSKIGDFFETDKVNGSKGDYYSGCETCDYGSSYEASFVIEE